MKEALWIAVRCLFFSPAWPWPSGLRVAWLRLFGAKVGRGVVIRSRVTVHFPWRLDIGDFVWLGEDSWLLNLDKITVGDNVCISQRAFLCTGSHNYKSATFDLMTKPIVVEDGAWLGASCWVGPGVTVRTHAVLAAGSVANKELEAWSIYQGNPAVFVRRREIVEDGKDKTMHRSMNTAVSENAGRRAGVGTDFQVSRLAWLLLCAPLAYLWFQVIDTVRLEWSSNPQYGYGWVVPILCAGLLLRRWQSMEAPAKPEKPHPAIFVVAFGALAFLYLPTRLIQAATPEWRPIQWLLGIETIGLTLCAIYFARGRAWAMQLAFPICFFLVAIPWPTIIETPVIQNLTQLSAALAVEAVGGSEYPLCRSGI